MKSIMALAAFVGGMVFLQGCGGSYGTASERCDPFSYGRYDSEMCDCLYGTQQRARHQQGLADLADYGRFVCPGHGNREVYVALFNDIIDGDVKEVRWAGNTMNISSTGLARPWSAVATLDEATCSGSVDFPVPGKLHPPAGPLTATVYSSLAVEKECLSSFKYVISFSTHSAADTATTSSPVHQWIEADFPRVVASTNVTCPTQLAGDFSGSSLTLKPGVADLLWDVKINGSSLTLKPGVGNDQEWTVEAEIDATDCSARVRLPGAGFEQLAQIRLSVMAVQTVKDAMANPLYYIMFSDPTGTARPPMTGPINQWTQLSTQQQLATSMIA